MNEVGKDEGLRTLFAAQLGRVHRLAKNLDRHAASLGQCAVLLIVLLQQALCAGIVRTGACGLPATVVARGIAQVQLELPPGVPPGVDERDAKGSETTVLGVALLKVAESADELLAGNVFVVSE